MLHLLPTSAPMFGPLLCPSSRPPQDVGHRSGTEVSRVPGWRRLPSQELGCLRVSPGISGCSRRVEERVKQASPIWSNGADTCTSQGQMCSNRAQAWSKPMEPSVRFSLRSSNPNLIDHNLKSDGGPSDFRSPRQRERSPRHWPRKGITCRILPPELGLG